MRKVRDAPAVDASEFNIDADRERFKAGTLKREVFKMLEEAWQRLWTRTSCMRWEARTG